MKTTKQYLFVIISCMICAFAAAQKVTISGEAVVGMPGVGNSLLTFNTERSWVFRQLETGPATALELYSTSGLKNFVITTTGNVGIGVPAPAAKLHVAGSIMVGPRITFGSAEYIEDGGGFIITCNGSLISAVDGSDDLGSSSRRWRTVYASNGLVTTSDVKLKSNIQNIPYGLNDILKLHPVSFQWTNQPEYGPKLGLLAQEVQQVISEVVETSEFMRTEDSETLKKVPAANLGIYYADLIPVLIKGMQEQQQMIRQQEEHIVALESKTQLQEARLARLEQLLLNQLTAPVK